MKFNRLFYMNITYDCNNHCIFCISHNTKEKTLSLENPMTQIQYTDRIFQFSEKDIFIVNGGEPTLSKDFFYILEYLQNKKCHTVIYTNGRNLSNKSFWDKIKAGNFRWIIPLYGCEQTHDYYTEIKNSFRETYSGIKMFPDNMRKNMGIKFLVQNESQIEEFIKLFCELKFFCSDFHISLILSKGNAKQRFQLAQKASLLVNLIYEHFQRVKISNFPLCCLSEQLRIISENYDSDEELKIQEYYFILEQSVKVFNYDRNHSWKKECRSCKWNEICADNSKKYRPLVLEKSKSFLGEE